MFASTEGPRTELAPILLFRRVGCSFRGGGVARRSSSYIGGHDPRNGEGKGSVLLLDSQGRRLPPGQSRLGVWRGIEVVEDCAILGFSTVLLKNAQTAENESGHKSSNQARAFGSTEMK